MKDPPSPGRARLVLALLVAAVLALHIREVSFAFLSFDDGDYVVHNPEVNEGLSPHSLAWAATAYHSANWHPLTWISHQLDCQIFGLDPAGPHAVNVLLAAVATALLFLLLLESTRRILPSAFVAAAWGLHPLRVSSIAWISERKDLLAALFLFLTLLAWVRYARAPSTRRYLLALLWFALGLASKPSLIPVPFLLLAFDRWPLGRFGERSPLQLAREKLPFLALSLVSIVLTLGAQRAGGAVSSLAEIPLDARIGQAVRAILLYTEKTALPTSLAFFHPHPALVAPGWAPFGEGFLPALLFLVGASLVTFRLRERFPSLLSGWAAFLLMLLPAIGLVQVGEQGWAERYASLSTIWLVAAVAFLGLRGRVWPLLGAGLLVAWSFGSWKEAAHWSDSETLYRRALAVTERNYIAEASLAAVLLGESKDEEAEAHYRRAVEIRPEFPEALYGLGLVAQRDGRLAQAESAYRRAIAVDADRAQTWLNLGAVLGAKGDLLGAVDAFAHTLRLGTEAPESAAAARDNLEALRRGLSSPDKAADPKLQHLLQSVESALQGDPQAGTRTP